MTEVRDRTGEQPSRQVGKKTKAKAVTPPSDEIYGALKQLGGIIWEVAQASLPASEIHTGISSQELVKHEKPITAGYTGL